MELRDYITKADALYGRPTLKERLRLSSEQITNAKAHRCGLPGYACVILAQLLQEDERVILAASELVTERDPRKRAVWLPFVESRKAAAWLLSIATTAFLGTVAPKDAAASDTFIASPAAAHPVPALHAGMPNVYYVKSWLRRLMEKALAALDKIAACRPLSAALG